MSAVIKGFAREVAAPASQSAPVKVWAVVGLGVLSIIVNAVIRWITSDYFTPSPTGTDPVPALTLFLIRTLEIVGTIGAVSMIWIFLVRPILRNREVSWDGMLLMICFSMWIQDPMDDYFNFTFSYNAYFINMASWSVFLPGWSSPRHEYYPEPILFMGGMYIWFVFGFSILGCWVMNRCRSTWLPRSSVMSHLAVVFAALAALDLVIEVLCIRQQLFAYGGVVRSWSLWPGTPHQFPLYESLLIGLLCTALTAFRYFRDDKGLSFAEKGLEQLQLSKPAKKLVSFASMLGFVHVFFFVLFFMPYNWMALHVDSYPQMPSYLNATICGQGTPYACPSREVPIPTLNSLAIAPDDPRLSAAAKRN